ncbi:hypothetical protein L202_05635 [Cryptococcus amylolentus CBS 6039]|uniref:Uncharacterized protein n=2 Tax=Cryptococcus amylolentus TaxID=104669 RepID=A0A1E3HL82_9TREE|nr:hypothetical protein L202_05635 [Cryptococcus amylolentus CBS 6039]ODN77100.1 hypothetical protein L202_05635 [Cryptococcus amylolentus CBS 6039]ODO04952.1 hypothetical protein I350_05563 [Cryptococcus amylolentus CBS 6273]
MPKVDDSEPASNALPRGRFTVSTTAVASNVDDGEDESSEVVWRPTLSYKTHLDSVRSEISDAFGQFICDAVSTLQGQPPGKDPLVSRNDGGNGSVVTVEEIVEDFAAVEETKTGTVEWSFVRD